MKKSVNPYAFEKISSSMAKEFGSIKRGYEDDYSFNMFPIEGNLLKINRKYHINNGRRAIEAIKICLFIISGYLNKIEYDLDKYITNENENFIKAILMAIDPFTNNKISDILSSDYDLNSTDDLRKYFTIPIKCLLRIEKSIQFWTDNQGVNGYFDFIENQLGQTVEKDDQMNFVIQLLDE